MLALIFAALYLLIFTGFLAYTIHKWYLPDCYSYMFYLWKGEGKQAVWQIISSVSGILLGGSMAYACDPANWISFLCFVAPVALLGVTMFPNYLENKISRIGHTVSAGFCAVAALLWMIFIPKLWIVGLLSLLLIIIVALVTETVRKSIVWWLEMVLFLGTGLAAFIVALNNI